LPSYSPSSINWYRVGVGAFSPGGNYDGETYVPPEELKTYLDLTTDAEDTAQPYDGIPDIEANGTSEATFTIKKKDHEGTVIETGTEDIIVETSYPVRLSAVSVTLSDGTGSFTITSQDGIKGVVGVTISDAAGNLEPASIELQFA